MEINTLVANIVNNNETKELLKAYGLQALSVTWEDPSRYENSCLGKNISDLTLVLKNNTRFRNNMLMPIIRYPNFGDISYDAPISTFKIRVGNESSNAENKIISLKEYLQNIDKYCPDCVSPTNLYDSRDETILTSTQCCILPVQSKMKTEFAVQLFNYQSSEDNPAVLVILASKNGTSTQILGKNNQKLLFNDKGNARYFSAERLEDIRERNGDVKTKVDSFKEMKEDEKLDNVLMMIQIPLVVSRNTHPSNTILCSMMTNNSGGQKECMYSSPKNQYVGYRGSSSRSKGMDMGQLSVGSEEGRFLGTKGIRLVRDKTAPIRCTFQFYRVTDRNCISPNNIHDISEQLNQVSKVSTAKGSLVVDANNRPTASSSTYPTPPFVWDLYSQKMATFL
jgi:hypothetical protein